MRTLLIFPMENPSTKTQPRRAGVSTVFYGVFLVEFAATWAFFLKLILTMNGNNNYLPMGNMYIIINPKLYLRKCF